MERVVQVVEEWQESTMRSYKAWPVMAFAAMLGFGAGGCDSDRGGTAVADAHLEQELRLALQGDTVSAVFEDTAIDSADRAEPPVTEPPPVEPPPARVQRAETKPRERAPQAADPEPVRLAIERTETETGERIPHDPEPRARTAVISIGTMMSLTLDEALSTETSQPGDAFMATVHEAVHDADGTIVIPAGATVRGRVTHVQKSGRVGETALLNVAFEAVSWDDARYPLDATVVQANPERLSRSSTAEQIGKVAAGAAAGALIGRVIGGRNRDAVKGAVVGAAAGTAIALGTADVDAVLKAGSLMVIRIDQPIEVTIKP
jgi:hypothetical protein